MHWGACVASGSKPLRPHLQADPSAGFPCRVPPCPGTPNCEHARREPFSGCAVPVPVLANVSMIQLTLVAALR